MQYVVYGFRFAVGRGNPHPYGGGSFGSGSAGSQRSAFKLQGAPNWDIAPSTRTVLDIKTACIGMETKAPLYSSTNATHVNHSIGRMYQVGGGPWAMAFGDAVITPYSSARFSNHTVTLIGKSSLEYPYTRTEAASMSFTNFRTR
jgi:hypothetical protein